MTDSPKKPARLAPAAAPQQPSIGRIVIFQGSERGYAAMITGVSEKHDLLVNLTIFPDERWAEGYTAQRRDVGYSAIGTPSTWRWPERTP